MAGERMVKEKGMGESWWEEFEGLYEGRVEVPEGWTFEG